MRFFVFYMDMKTEEYFVLVCLCFLCMFVVFGLLASANVLLTYASFRRPLYPIPSASEPEVLNYKLGPKLGPRHLAV